MELEATNAALLEEENILEQLLTTIAKLKEDLKAPVNEAICLHKQVKLIQGSADED